MMGASEREYYELEKWRVDKALHVGSRSAMLHVVGDDGNMILIHIHDPHWRVALTAFRFDLEVIINRCSAHTTFSESP